MKAAPFDYALATDLEHALSYLDEYAHEAKLIAGGQSLVPMMSMRLARPQWLIDINRIDALKGFELQTDRLRTGACLRQRDIEYNNDIHATHPLIKKALSWVGHQQTRNRGTVGGSLAHADPSSELPLAAMVLDATMHLSSKSESSRALQAQDFFLGPMFTAISETECLTHIDWPIWSGGKVTCAFEETAIRKGDFAMGSAAAQLLLDANGRISKLSFGVGGMDGTPRVFPELASQLIGHAAKDLDVSNIVHEAIQACEPGSDMHASSAYRKHLGQVLLERVLHQCLHSALVA